MVKTSAGRASWVQRHALDLLTLGLFVVVAVLMASSPDHLRWSASPLVVAVFAAVFLFCEATQLRFEIRRQTYNFSISEVGLVLGLFLLDPLEILLIRLAAGLAVWIFLQRIPWAKVRVNTGVVAAEVAVATTVFALFGVQDPTAWTAWVASYVAVLLADATSTSGVIAAITIAQGRLSPPDLLRLGYSTVIAAVLNVTIGLIVLLVVGVRPEAVVLIGVLGVILAVGYRSYTQFQRQHKNLGELYEFTKAVTTARQETDLADALLSRTRELLLAESATLWMPSLGRYPEIALVAVLDTPGLVDEQVADDPIRRRVLATGATLHLGPKAGDEDAELLAALRARPAKDLIVVPLRSGDAVVGCLEVANRLGALSAFGAADVRLMETLAAHAAVAVENSRLVDRLRHDAYHDALTGLPNRRRLLHALEAAVEVQPAPGEVVAVLQFDVDALRDVNETLGHGAGDRLLAEVGRRLQTRAPDGALVARAGGDEFAVLVRVQGAEDAQAVAVALQHALAEPFALENLTLDVGAAVGIAVYPDHATDAESLLQRVDVATYAAKNNPRSIQVYRMAMESRSTHRLGLVSELRRAIDDGSLTVHYQPRVGLADRELVGVECLVRWEHPEHGLVSPDDFIPVAEHTGLVGALTSKVLRTALAQCKQWHDAGRPLGVSVNLSPRSLLDADFPDELEQLLRDVGLPPQHLTLEITESGMVAETDRPLPTLRRLFALGVRLAVDDFGTGYSSLAYLRRLPVHEVKIDKSFVLGMATDSGDLGIVRAIVDLSRHLGMTVVAEGVESEMTLTLLEEMGCDVAQGFLFSRPLPYERLEAWMNARTEFTAGEGIRRLRVVGEAR